MSFNLIIVSSFSFFLGAVYVKGALLATGIRAPLKKVKFFLRHVDPYGTMLRKRLRIRRRQYKVKGANSYW